MIIEGRVVAVHAADLILIFGIPNGGAIPE